MHALDSNLAWARPSHLTPLPPTPTPTPTDNKLTSFQRQLNLYGFRRITKGTDMGAYFHPQFRKDRPDLVARIRRLPGQVRLGCVEVMGWRW